VAGARLPLIRSVLHIPRVQQAGSDLVQRRQKLRLSIIGETLGPIDDVMLAELATEDNELGQAAGGVEQSNDGRDNNDDIEDLFNDEIMTTARTTSKTSPKLQSQDELSDEYISGLSDESTCGCLTSSIPTQKPTVGPRQSHGPFMMRSTIIRGMQSRMRKT
jgi:hypothetical protein